MKEAFSSLKSYARSLHLFFTNPVPVKFICKTRTKVGFRFLPNPAFGFTYLKSLSEIKGFEEFSLRHAPEKELPL
jgi:hypothetical protein